MLISQADCHQHCIIWDFALIVVLQCLLSQVNSPMFLHAQSHLNFLQSVSNRLAQAPHYMVLAYMQAGISQLVDDLNLSAHEFGENLSSSYNRYEALDEKATPTELAEDMVDGTPGKDSAQAILKAAKGMAAAEMAADPRVRAWLREQIWEKVTVSTGDGWRQVLGKPGHVHSV